jgi:hypothetical protein
MIKALPGWFTQHCAQLMACTRMISFESSGAKTFVEPAMTVPANTAEMIMAIAANDFIFLPGMIMFSPHSVIEFFVLDNLLRWHYQLNRHASVAYPSLHTNSLTAICVGMKKLLRTVKTLDYKHSQN